MVVMYGVMMVGMGMRVEMRGTVGLTVDMGMRLTLTHIAPQKQATSQAGDEQARDASQPGVQTLRDDVMREIQRHGTEQVHSCSMGGRHNQTQVQRVSGRTTGANQIGGHYGFAVPRLEGV